MYYTVRKFYSLSYVTDYVTVIARQITESKTIDEKK